MSNPYLYVPYYEKTDFSKKNWAEESNNTQRNYPMCGATALATATVISHPLIFVAGAATAVWIVGLYHTVDHGYNYFSGDQESVNDTFLGVPDEVPLRATTTQQHEHSPQSSQTSTIPNPPSHETQTTKQEKSSRDRTREYHITLRDIIKTNFPPLKVKVATGVPFMGLNAEEFFDVFFSDKAPYSFEAFQKTRGDVDIKYSNWETAIDDSFPNMLAHKSYNVPLPRINEKERKCTFRTLTKSYFGPAYASASKVMKFTTVGKNLLVLDARTKLSGIPYGDRFYVEERWVIESVKDCSVKDKAIYSSKLSVYVEVKMIKKFPGEQQIKKKTLSTMTEMLDAWCQRATAALHLAEMERKKRELATDLKSGEHQDISGRKIENVNLCNDASEPVEKETERQKVMVDVKMAKSMQNSKDTDMDTYSGTTASVESLDEESQGSSEKSSESTIRDGGSLSIKEIEECLVSSGAQSDDAKKFIPTSLEDTQQIRKSSNKIRKGLFKRKTSIRKKS